MKSHEDVHLLANLVLLMGLVSPFLTVILSIRARRTFDNPRPRVWMAAILTTTFFALSHRVLLEWGTALQISQFDQDGDGWVDFYPGVIPGREMTSEESKAVACHSGRLGRQLFSMAIAILSPFYAIVVMTFAILFLAGLRRAKKRRDQDDARMQF